MLVNHTHLDTINDTLVLSANLGSRLHHTFQPSMYFNILMCKPQGGPKCPPSPPKIAPRWPQHGPRWIPKCPRWHLKSSRTRGVDADLPSGVHFGCDCSADNCSANMRQHDHHLPMGSRSLFWSVILPRQRQDRPRRLQKSLRWHLQSSRTPGVDADLPSCVHFGCECFADNCSANMQQHDDRLHMRF